MTENFLQYIRNDELTTFFKIIPFFASDYFYITIIAIGYWIRPNLSLFKDLGFLVAFSTLITCILKNIFAFSRPDIALHLVAVKDPYGFPSGDVLVAIVFWYVLCKHAQSTFLNVIATLQIILISCSRIYLGVHTVSQVIGGLGFGVIIVILWILYGRLTEKWYQGKTVNFWLLLVLSGILYEILHYKAPSSIGMMSIGSLLGYGLALKYMNRNNEAKELTIELVILMIISLVCLVVVAKYFPIFYENDLTLQISIMLKYAILVNVVYSLSYLFSFLQRSKNIAK